MNLLVGFGHVADPEAPKRHRDVWEQLGDEVRIFSNVGGDVLYRPGMAFDDILTGLQGFVPDVVVLLSPEYWPPPEGLEDFDHPVVAMIGDWNLNTLAVLLAQQAIDYNFVDQAGVEFLRSWGVKADYFPIFSHQPHLHYRMPDLPKIYDVVFVGNLSSSIQEERNRWLYRLARLSSRYRIKICGSVYGEEYTRLLNQSKITFNRSIRGEMNMRAFEAAACGSLLFMEKENREVRDFFEDRVHCVLYNEENFENLLEHYLKNDAERERLIEKAHARVQELTYPDRIRGFLQSLRHLPSEKKRKALFPPERVRSLLEVCFSGQEFMGDLEQKLIEALSLDPENPVLAFNAGFCFYREGKLSESLSWFERCRSLLLSGREVDLSFLPAIPPFSDFAIRWHGTYREGKAGISKRQNVALFSEASLLSALASLKLGEIKKGISVCREGLEQVPDHFALLETEGILLEEEGRVAEARQAYAKALNLRPLEWRLWKSTLRVLRETVPEAASEFLDSHLEIAGAFPQAGTVRQELLSAFFGGRKEVAHP